MFTLLPRFGEMGSERRDRELLLMSTFKALDGSGNYQVLERMLNDL